MAVFLAVSEIFRDK